MRLKSFPFTFLFVLTYGSLENEFCKALTGDESAICDTDSHCRSEENGIKYQSCCSRDISEKTKEFRESKRESISEIAGCVALIQYVLNHKYEYTGRHLHRRTVKCTREALAHSFSIQLLMTVLEVIVNTPTIASLDLPEDRVDESWWNMENDLEPSPNAWSADTCNKHREIIKRGEELKTNGIIPESPMWEQGYLDRFLHYCSMLVYEEARADLFTDTLFVYAKAYLESIARLELDAIVAWGHLPKVLAHFIYLAASGVYDPVIRKDSASCSDPEPFVPLKLMETFGIH